MWSDISRHGVSQQGKLSYITYWGWEGECLRTFWSLFPNKPIWDLVIQFEEWSLFRWCTGLFGICQSFSLPQLQGPCQATLTYLKMVHRTIERAPMGKPREYFPSRWGSLVTLHVLLILLYMCTCVTCVHEWVHVLIWKPETASGVIFLDPSTLVFSSVSRLTARAKLAGWKSQCLTL